VIFVKCKRVVEQYVNCIDYLSARVIVWAFCENKKSLSGRTVKTLFKKQSDANRVVANG